MPFSLTSHPKYRPDIDGLRAVAVSLVLAFHAFPTLAEGGFIGVDVFFVISGFLISTVIFEDLKREQFSFLSFYSRRIRRIFPALIVTMALCLGVGWFALFADEYQQLGKHVAAGGAFVSNYVLWGEKGYFDNASNTKILLHLWSLGIEEQFYIVWPLLLWALWKCRVNAQIAIAVLGVASFYLSKKQVTLDLTAAFYSPQTRFWELLAGSALAVATVQYKRRPWAWVKQGLAQLGSKGLLWASHAASLIGTGLIAAGVYLITEKTLFPGTWALYPVGGTVLLIAAGPHAIVNRWVLCHRTLVWVGLISFPLYLFHWPLLAFARILADGTSPATSWRIAALVASFVLAILTFQFVEKPIRFGMSNRKALILLASSMAAIATAGYAIYQKNGFPSRYPSSQNEQRNRSWKLEGPGVQLCRNLLTSEKVTFFCAISPLPTVALIGDSHAGHLFYGFTTGKNERYARAMVVGAGACQASIGMESTVGCTEPVNMAVKLATTTPSIKVAIIAGYYGFIDLANSERAAKFVTGFSTTIEKLRGAGKRVVFVIDNPSLKETAEKCYHPALRIRAYAKEYPEFCRGAQPGDLKEQTEYLKFVEVLRKQHPEVLFYNPKDVLCPAGTCMIEKDGELLYGDNNHLSIFGSRLVVADLIAKIESATWR